MITRKTALYMARLALFSCAAAAKAQARLPCTDLKLVNVPFTEESAHARRRVSSMRGDLSAGLDALSLMIMRRPLRGITLCCQNSSSTPNWRAG